MEKLKNSKIQINYWQIRTVPFMQCVKTQALLPTMTMERVKVLSVQAMEKTLMATAMAKGKAMAITRTNPKTDEQYQTHTYIQWFARVNYRKTPDLPLIKIIGISKIGGRRF